MLTPNLRARTIASWLLTDFEMQTRTSGGWSDSDANEATVRPYGFPSHSVVTTVTPVAKCDRAVLNCASSIAIVFSRARSLQTFGGRRAYGGRGLVGSSVAQSRGWSLTTGQRSDRTTEGPLRIRAANAPVNAGGTMHRLIRFAILLDTRHLAQCLRSRGHASPQLQRDRRRNADSRQRPRKSERHDRRQQRVGRGRRGGATPRR